MNGVGPPTDVTPASSVCNSCGNELPSTFKFCNECGTAVASATSPAEYKQVTVLFADVVHWMDLAAAVGAERLREIMAGLADRCAAVVARYGSTLTQWTGDGIMAVFGAPVALEDHAVRACLAALDIQREAVRLAIDVDERDDITLRLRVGLNSGEVIAGGIGSGQFGYAAVGEQVGMAQRMEAVAPPSGIMLSASTARLVERAATLGEWELAQIKGAREPVPARQLLGMADRPGAVRRAESRLVGRSSQMATAVDLLDRAAKGRGAIVAVVGSAGIGKSRLAREAASAAAGRGIEVVWAFCESHASDIAFHAVTRLLRASLRVTELAGAAARARVRERIPDADPQDLLLLDDLLGIADPEIPLPPVDPDARRRRLTAMINTASLARREPTLFIIEDAHWIDAVSESLLADFLTVISQTPSLVLITSRPEYRGALIQARDGQTITLSPLGDSDSAALIAEFLGHDPSVGELGRMIAERAAGNPFFVEELVRELVQRGALIAEHADYICQTHAADITVPATVQAAIEARIDRLSGPAKRTLNAASVIGARFADELLSALVVDVAVDELLHAELVDQVRIGPVAEYAFRHPLIRATAYASQLKSDRAAWHLRLAVGLQERAPGPVEEHAALIAEHLEAADELHGAYAWHMRAGEWSTNRDLVAARLSWERARQIADRLPAQDPARLSMRIAPRTMLCATDLQAREVQESQGRYTELQELCEAAGDNASLAIGMSALATALCFSGHAREAAQLSSQQMALLDTLGDLGPIMGLAVIAFINWLGVGEFDEILRWSQTVIEMAAGDPDKGAGFGVASPLAIALAWRGTSRWWLGRPGWHQDLHDAVTMARRGNPETLSGAIAWSYGFAMQYGVLRADATVVRASQDALHNARGASSDRALGLAGYTAAVALLNQDTVADRRRGFALMSETRALWLRMRARFLIPVADVWLAREHARRGDHDAALDALHPAVDRLRQAGHLFYGAWATGVLVETLLERGAQGDVTEAEDLIEELATGWAEDQSAMREITLLRLRTLLAGARGDDVAYPELARRYRDMAESCGYERHRDWAAEMADS